MEERHKIDVEQKEAPPQTDDPAIREEPEPQHTISDMVRDGFVFFTPALITTHGLFDRDPVVEFNRTHSTEDEAERPFFIDCQFPFFDGLGFGFAAGQFVNWDHRLYGICKANWGALCGFIKALAWYDPKRYNYARVGSHKLRIVDPTALHGSGIVLDALPTIEITVFCVSTYRGFVWISPALDPPRTHPFPRVDQPSKELRKEAEMVLGPPPAPERLAQGPGS